MPLISHTHIPLFVSSSNYGMENYYYYYYIRNRPRNANAEQLSHTGGLRGDKIEQGLKYCFSHGWKEQFSTAETRFRVRNTLLGDKIGRERERENWLAPRFDECLLIASGLYSIRSSRLTFQTRARLRFASLIHATTLKPDTQTGTAAAMFLEFGLPFQTRSAVNPFSKSM